MSRCISAASFFAAGLCGILMASAAPPALKGPDAEIAHYAQTMLDQGRKIFRYDTFGSEAFWILAPAAVPPMASIVVTSEAPMLPAGVTQERLAAPSICTVQAPHSAMPQPNLVPVRPITSRSTHSSGVSSSASTLCAFPLTLMVKAMAIFSVQRDEFRIAGVDIQNKVRHRRRAFRVWLGFCLAES